MEYNPTGTQSSYPYWHNQPLRLSREEIKHPFLALDAFFDFCSLSQARSLLQEWLVASLHGGEDPFTYFKELVEKLVEASWLIFQGEKNDQRETEPLLEKEHKLALDRGSVCKRRAQKGEELFQQTELDELKAELHVWCDIALCSDKNIYNNGSRRERLITLCRTLPSLMEALYYIHGCRPELGGGGHSFTNVQFMDILGSGGPFLIPDGPQTAKRIKIVQGFCIQFERNYVQEELWNILDAVVGGKKTGSRSVNPFFLYACFLSVAEAAYTLAGAIKKKKSKNKIRKKL